MTLGTEAVPRDIIRAGGHERQGREIQELKGERTIARGPEAEVAPQDRTAEVMGWEGP